MAAVLNTLLGAALAIMVTVIVEWMRKPRLRVTLGSHHDDSYQDDRPARTARFLTVKLSNQQLPLIFRWLLRSPAMQCRGYVAFHHLDGQPVFQCPMAARWTGSREPVLPEVLIAKADEKSRSTTYSRIGYIFDAERLELVGSRDIHVGDPQSIDIAARFDEDSACFGWCGENYFSEPRWRTPQWKMEADRYLVRVKMTSAGNSCSGMFRLVNDTDRSSFRLEGATAEDRKSVGSWMKNHITKP